MHNKENPGLSSRTFFFKEIRLLSFKTSFATQYSRVCSYARRKHANRRACEVPIWIIRSSQLSALRAFVSRISRERNSDGSLHLHSLPSPSFALLCFRISNFSQLCRNSQCLRACFEGIIFSVWLLIGTRLSSFWTLARLSDRRGSTCFLCFLCFHCFQVHA